MMYHQPMDTDRATTAASPGALPVAVATLLAGHPDYRERLVEIVAYEEANPPVVDPGTGLSWGGWCWQDVHTRPPTLNVMVGEGVLDMIYQSRSQTRYQLRDRPATKEALTMPTDPDLVLLRGGAAPSAPSDRMFELVIGHDWVKLLLLYALRADEPVHVLLTGPPGTAKTLLLSAISHLTGAELYAGSTTTKAGLVGMLLRTRPRYLALDEVDKMAEGDMTPLLNLMEGGVVTRLHFNVAERVTLPTRVFATANDTRRLSDPILSRFLKIDVPAYTAQEFTAVTRRVLEVHAGLGPQVSDLIANEVARYSLDVRDAIRVARLTRGRIADVPLIVRAMFDRPRGHQLRTMPLREG